MKILKAAEAFDKSAKIYQDKFMDVSLFGETFNLFCNHIAADNAEILDIACGPGNITKYVLDRKPDYQVLGIDLSPKMLDLAQANNPTAAFQLMDCREIGQIKKRFDGIICGFCLPYLVREEAVDLIAQASQLLKPGGVFYLSTMEDDYAKSRFQTSSTGDQVYVNYHQEDYLTEALQVNNFEIINIQRFTSYDKDNVMITDLVLTGKLI
ncbi:Methyltransferase domain-containing protein [Chryseobacterium oleae]|uniref:Methyltransferase domain-containing protein n=1 Tax=Chryseobacterium oleae TaxID=491207 RepID=A0A1I4YE02_CHROL|nr:class I SAM-dependent methyltransferase [Chryseobacterium oleae]SFN36265.1 Methyltransferase domain-containing protein [Chryseobacterium oleae]